jgi:hypothetical protein
MVDKWRKMSPGERLRVQIIIGFLVLGLYGSAVYPFTRKQFTEAKNLLHRRQDRIEKRTETDVKATSANPQAVRRQIEETDKKLREIKENFNELDTGFAPLDSGDMRQQLLVEISTLARRTGVELQSVARKGLEGKSGQELLDTGGRRVQPVAADSGQMAVDPSLGRPLLLVSAVGQYEPLLSFLRGLKELSFYVSPMQIRLYSRHLKDGGKGGGAVPIVAGGEEGEGLLNIFLELSM